MDGILSAQALLTALTTKPAAEKPQSGKGCVSCEQDGKFSAVLQASMKSGDTKTGKLSSSASLAAELADVKLADVKEEIASKLGISVKQLNQLMMAIKKLGVKKVKELARGDEAAEDLMAVAKKIASEMETEPAGEQLQAFYNKLRTALEELSPADKKASAAELKTAEKPELAVPEIPAAAEKPSGKVAVQESPDEAEKPAEQPGTSEPGAPEHLKKKLEIGAHDSAGESKTVAKLSGEKPPLTAEKIETRDADADVSRLKTKTGGDGGEKTGTRSGESLKIVKSSKNVRNTEAPADTEAKIPFKKSAKTAVRQAAAKAAASDSSAHAQAAEKAEHAFRQALAGKGPVVSEKAAAKAAAGQSTQVEADKQTAVLSLKQEPKSGVEKDGFKLDATEKFVKAAPTTVQSVSEGTLSGGGREGAEQFGGNFTAGSAESAMESGRSNGGAETRFGQNVIFNQIVDKFQALSNNGSVHSVRMQLHPEFLGEVEVRLTVRNGSLVAQFNVENTVVKDILDASTSSLKQSLADAGIDVGSLEVNVSQGGLSWQQQQKNGFVNDGSHKRGRISIDDLEEIEASLAAGDTEVPLDVRLALNGGLFDMVA